MRKRILAVLIISLVIFSTALYGCSDNSGSDDGGVKAQQKLIEAIDKYTEQLSDKFNEYSSEKLREEYNAGLRAIRTSNTAKDAEKFYKLSLEIFEEISAKFSNTPDLIINYLDRFGNHVHPRHYATLEKGNAFSIPSPTVYGYTTISTLVSGIINSDTIVDVVYDFSGTISTIKRGNGDIVANGTVVGAYTGASGDDWLHATDTFKYYIKDKDGFTGDFKASVFLNTQYPALSNAAGDLFSRTARLYITNKNNPSAYTVFGITSDFRSSGGSIGTVTSPSMTGTYTRETASTVNKNCDILLVIERTGSTIKWTARIIPGEGTGLEGQVFEKVTTIASVNTNDIQLALTNRGYADFTVKGVIVG